MEIDRRDGVFSASPFTFGVLFIFCNTNVYTRKGTAMRDVEEYYNRNTSAFLRFGHGTSRSGGIHRALWAPEVTTVAEAMDYIHTRIVAALRKGTPTSDGVRHYGDMGCGVGTSVLRIAEITGAAVTGVTLSPVQYGEAQKRIARWGEQRRPVRGPCRVFRGDFTDPALLARVADRGPLDGAWMVESYNHADDAETLLGGIAGIIRPGGVFTIVDDFPADSLIAGDPSPRVGRLRDEFLSGWHVKTFLPPSRLKEIAARHGFDHILEEDYSAYIAHRRLRDYLVRAGAAVGRVLRRSSPGWDNLRGGSALEQLSREGYIRYQLHAFLRRQGVSAADSGDSGDILSTR